MPSTFAVVPGSGGGNFGDWIWHEPIDGFGTLGFGTDGELECAELGTCCLPDGSCESLTAYWCKRADGVYFESGSCSDCESVGACCTDWSCAVRPETDCRGENETWLGGGSTCEPNECVPLGSCCLPDGSCVVLRENECREEFGAFLVGMDCTLVDCYVGFGACCYIGWETLCRLASQEECEALGSVYLGDGTTCEPEPCLPGVCCVQSNSGVCPYTTPEDCEDLGGYFIPGPAGPPDEACEVCCCGPTEESSWGEVKAKFR
ncbi:MAG: hypothetical protein R3E97_04820 [Candidatus Eisenbacteria bacterium]